MSGVLSKYGGFRRNTVLEVWQYFPTCDRSKVFNFSIEQHKNVNNQEDTKFLKWITGVKNIWSDQEIDLLLQNIDLHSINTCLVISENKEFKINHSDFDKINFVLITPKEFTQFKLKKDRKTDSYVIPKISTKYDLIIIDECNTIGGNTVLTSALKVLLKQSIARKGFIAMKSYFDPVLEKNNAKKITGEAAIPNLRLKSESIILYGNYEKINSLHLYKSYTLPKSIKINQSQ